MFREDYPLAWHFHQNTSRTGFNRLEYQPERRTTPPFKEYLNVPVLSLPPAEHSECSLADAIQGRCSCRRFDPTSLSSSQVATLLKAGYGAIGLDVTGGTEMVERPVPSGGGLYPLELYPILLRAADVPAGIYHYQPLYHALEEIQRPAPPAQLLAELFLSQRWIAEAACLIVITGVVGRSFWKYEDRGYRYLLLEVGHLAQNICLTCSSLKLGALPLGGFLDQDLSQLLGLDAAEEIPLYAVAIGKPQGQTRAENREPRGGFDSQ